MSDDVADRAEAVERWLPVVGFEDRYQVSDLGRVYSLITGQLLSLRTTDRDGRPRVSLTGGAKVRTRPVHRLVLEAFVGPCPDGMEGCHSNGDTSDNRLVNLRWDTKSANMQDCLAHGRHGKLRKTHCPKGHPYAGDNLYQNSNSRKCRTCQNARTRVKAIKPGEELKHGTVTTYTRGCRCDDCKGASALAARRLRARKREAAQ